MFINVRERVRIFYFEFGELWSLKVLVVDKANELDCLSGLLLKITFH